MKTLSMLMLLLVVLSIGNLLIAPSAGVGTNPGGISSTISNNLVLNRA